MGDIDASTRVGRLRRDDQVIARHRRVIEAAVRVGVDHLVYTSLSGAGDHLAFALAHRRTEQMIKNSGIDWTILRNGLYAELFGALLTWQDGGLRSAFGNGALAAVTRHDLAVAAATVAVNSTKHRRTSYELVGTPITADDIAERVEVGHRTISLGDYREQLLASDGLLPFQPPMLLSIASAVRHGFMDETATDLATLLGRPAADPLTAAASAALSTRPPT